MALINVAKARIPCPICGKNDWCMVSDDGKLALCQRVENNHPNKKGGWWHSLENNIRYDKQQFKTKEMTRKAPDYILDQVYHLLLEQLPLTDEHKEALKKRGINDKEIDFFNYKSLQVRGRYEVSKVLEKRFSTKILKLTPGFYTQKGKYGNYITIAGGTGFMIPIINVYKQICGIQIRVDQPTRDTKYIWLSSSEKYDGTNSGTPLHIAFPPIMESKDIWITEGPLKANILAWRKKCIAIAAPGIAHWMEIPQAVKKIQQFYHTSNNCIIAYDADYKEKIYVREHAINLNQALQDNKINSIFATWELSEGKGIDDIIVNHGIINFVSAI